MTHSDVLSLAKHTSDPQQTLQTYLVETNLTMHRFVCSACLFIIYAKMLKSIVRTHLHPEERLLKRPDEKKQIVYIYILSIWYVDKSS